MKEIIFRGKTEDDGKWVYGDLQHDRNCFGNICEIRIREFNAEHGTTFALEVEPATVGQFTGLTDKNGKKIFEGDIVSIYGGIRQHEVRWENGSCGFEPFSDSIENCGHCGGGELPEECEVIGNIHDNPELL